MNDGTTTVEIAAVWLPDGEQKWMALPFNKESWMTLFDEIEGWVDPRFMAIGELVGVVTIGAHPVGWLDALPEHEGW
jgi:hypothetical protein